MIAAYHLKEMRLERDLTQEHLAFELNVSQKTYSNKENGNARITMRDLKNISRVFECNALELVSKFLEFSPQLIEKIGEENKTAASYDIHHGINENLTLELLKTYRARIEDLENMVAMKDETIARLEKKLIN